VPVVTCTKCPTQLRVPEGATGNVKCPKCKNVFSVGAKPAPAFEVVDEAPAKPAPAARPAAPAARPATAATAPVARPAPPPPPAPAKKSEPEEDFNFDDDTPKKKRRGDDDDDRDRDRDRKKKRRDDDDDDDRNRPRSKRRRDDDDDEDDRPRRKGRGRRDDYDDDDEDDYRPPSKKGSGFGHAKTGVLLMSIGLWLYMAAFATLALFFLLLMATRIPDGLMAVAGICGVGNTILTIVGLSFCIAGPKQAKGMAIATLSVAGAHLILVAISYNNLTGGLSRGGLGGGFVGGIDWVMLGTVIWVPDIVLPALIYGAGSGGGGGSGGGSGEVILLILAGACEIARMIMVCVTIKSLAAAAKDSYSAEKAGRGVMVTCVVCGAAAIGFTLLVVIIDATKSLNALRYLGSLGVTAIWVGYALMALTGALAALSTKDSLARRARRG
jgi:phage FluMu protein Com